MLIFSASLASKEKALFLRLVASSKRERNILFFLICGSGVSGICGGSRGEDVAIEVGKLVTMGAKVAVGLWCGTQVCFPEIIIKWARGGITSPVLAVTTMQGQRLIFVGRSNDILTHTQRT